VANKEQAQNIPATILYCIGGFIMGLGYAPFYCLSLVYIDNNVEDVHDTAKYVCKLTTFQSSIKVSLTFLEKSFTFRVRCGGKSTLARIILYQFCSILTQVKL